MNHMRWIDMEGARNFDQSCPFETPKSKPEIETRNFEFEFRIRFLIWTYDFEFLVSISSF